MKDDSIINFGHFLSNPQMMVLSNLTDGSLMDANKAFFKILEYDRSDLIEKDILGLGFLYQKDRDAIETCINSHTPIIDQEVIFRSKTGKAVVGLLSCTFVIANDATYLKTIITNITKQKFQEIATQKLNELNQLELCSMLAYC
jgi:PAS domain S-box-containing protein